MHPSSERLQCCITIKTLGSNASFSSSEGDGCKARGTRSGGGSRAASTYERATLVKAGVGAGAGAGAGPGVGQG